MELSELLTPGRAQCAAPDMSKKRVLELISKIASESYPNLKQHELFESLLSREKMGCTGIGKGIALPHGRISKVDKPTAVLIKCEQPIQYDAIDRQPVDLLFALFVPKDHNQQYLHLLSQIATKLSQKEFCKALRKAPDSQALYDLATQN